MTCSDRPAPHPTSVTDPAPVQTCQLPSRSGAGSPPAGRIPGRRDPERVRLRSGGCGCWTAGGWPSLVRTVEAGGRGGIDEWMSSFTSRHGGGVSVVSPVGRLRSALRRCGQCDPSVDAGPTATGYRRDRSRTDHNRPGRLPMSSGGHRRGDTTRCWTPRRCFTGNDLAMDVGHTPDSHRTDPPTDRPSAATSTNANRGERGQKMTTVARPSRGAFAASAPNSPSAIVPANLFLATHRSSEPPWPRQGWLHPLSWSSTPPVPHVGCASGRRHTDAPGETPVAATGLVVYRRCAASPSYMAVPTPPCALVYGRPAHSDNGDQRRVGGRRQHR